MLSSPPCFWLPAPAARCESAPALTEQGLELSGSSVRYPQITGMADEALQAAVNEALLATGDVENRLNRLSALISDPAALTVDYEATLAGDVLSCVYSAEGAVESSAVTHVYSALNLDLAHRRADRLRRPVRQRDRRPGAAWKRS